MSNQGKAYKKEVKDHHISEYLKSGLSIEKYCENMDFVPSTMSKWAAEHRNENGLPSPVDERKRNAMNHAASFVAEHEKSGISKKEYARKYLINYANLAKWVRKYGKMGTEQEEFEDAVLDVVGKEEFEEVIAYSLQEGGGFFSITVKAGLTDDEVDQALIKNIGIRRERKFGNILEKP